MNVATASARPHGFDEEACRPRSIARSIPSAPTVEAWGRGARGTPREGSGIAIVAQRPKTKTQRAVQGPALADGEVELHDRGCAAAAAAAQGGDGNRASATAGSCHASFSKRWSPQGRRARQALGARPPGCNEPFPLFNFSRRLGRFLSQHATVFDIASVRAGPFVAVELSSILTGAATQSAGSPRSSDSSAAAPWRIGAGRPSLCRATSSTRCAARTAAVAVPPRCPCLPAASATSTAQAPAAAATTDTLVASV